MEARGGATEGQGQQVAGQAGGQRLRVTLVKSVIGYRESQRLTVRSLGLRRLNQSVEHDDSPSIRGMLTKVRHLVRVEELPVGAAAVRRETGADRFARRRQKKAAQYAALAAELLPQAPEPGGTGAAATKPTDTPAVAPAERPRRGGRATAASEGDAPTEAGATAEQEGSLRERIGDTIEAVQERAGDAVDAAQEVVGGAVDRVQELAGRAVDTVQDRLDLEGSGSRSNDAVEAEAEEPAPGRRRSPGQ